MVTIKHDASHAGGTAIVHLDPEQRARNGRAARAAFFPIRAWDMGTRLGRADPAALLAAQETTRVPDLVPARHERMLESPFTFYRGAAVIMAADLGATPNAGLSVQACGDAHLSNFGGFASPDRSLVFDINDFDETSTGPFEWDVKRLGASFEIAARAREAHESGSSHPHDPRHTDVSRGHGVLREGDQPRRVVRAARRAKRVRPVPFAGERRGQRSDSRKELPRPRPKTA